MFTETLPIDLIDRILSFLRYDSDTLITCTKSHPILSDLSERYIYANVVLRDDIYAIHTPTNLRTSQFTQILAKKSAIAKHVRSLEVVCVYGDPGSEQHEVTSSHLDGVASLLPMLTGLTKFVIRGSRNNRDGFPWHAVPETFCQAFLHYLPQDIVIRNIFFFPMTLLNHFGNAMVSLDRCDKLQYDRKSVNAVQSYPLPFEHLSVSHCSETNLDNISAWAKVRGLHSLKYQAFSSSSLQRLFVACSDSLTSLHLDTPRYMSIDTSYQISNDSAIPDGDIAHFPFTLTSLHHLTQLRFTLGHYYYSGGRHLELPIPAISELLSSARPTLKQMSIEIGFFFHGAAIERENSLVSTAVWLPFTPLAAKCSSSSITMYIHPSFDIANPLKKASQRVFSHLADYKGLTTYVQSGVVVVKV